MWDVLETHTFQVWCRKAVKWEEVVQNQLYCQMLHEEMLLVKWNKCYYICMFSKAVLSNHDLIGSRELNYHCSLFIIWLKIPKLPLAGPQHRWQGLSAWWIKDYKSLSVDSVVLITAWGRSSLAGLGRLGFYPLFPIFSWAAHLIQLGFFICL